MYTQNINGYIQDVKCVVGVGNGEFFLDFVFLVG